MIPGIDYELFGLTLIEAVQRVSEKQVGLQQQMLEVVTLAEEQLNIAGDTYVAWHLSEIVNRVLAILYPKFFDWHQWTTNADERNDHLRSRGKSELAPAILIHRVLYGISSFDSNDKIKTAATRLLKHCPDTGPKPDRPFQDDIVWY